MQNAIEEKIEISVNESYVSLFTINSLLNGPQISISKDMTKR